MNAKELTEKYKSECEACEAKYEGEVERLKGEVEAYKIQEKALRKVLDIAQKEIAARRRMDAILQGETDEVRAIKLLCRAGNDDADRADKAEADIAACRKELDEARGKVEKFKYAITFAPIPAVVKDWILSQILKGATE